MVNIMNTHSATDCMNLVDDFFEDDDLFDDLEPISRFEFDKISWAASLCSALAHKKISRSDLASTIGYSRGRITKILSGDENLTLKTISTLSEALGLGVELSFINEHNIKASQPWVLGITEARLKTHSESCHGQYITSTPYGSNVMLHLYATPISEVSTNKSSHAMLEQLIESKKVAINQVPNFQLPLNMRQQISTIGDIN